MASCDLEDNHSLMKLYTHKLETRSFQRMCGFPRFVDNKQLSQLSQEQKCSPDNRWKMWFLCLVWNDCRDYSEVFLVVWMCFCDILGQFHLFINSQVEKIQNLSLWQMVSAWKLFFTPVWEPLRRPVGAPASPPGSGASEWEPAASKSVYE